MIEVNCKFFRQVDQWSPDGIPNCILEENKPCILALDGDTECKTFESELVEE